MNPSLNGNILFLDEVEAIRLSDLEGLYQEEQQEDSAMKRRILALSAVSLLIFVSACSDGLTTSSEGSSDNVLPMFADDNGNGINDYVELGTHDSGTVAMTQFAGRNAGPGLYGHGYVDGNGDGICDFAQNGSNTWHGPGFTDEDGDGVCDYWQIGARRYNNHAGLQFRDTNRNRINDFLELRWHEAYNHNFTDNDGDGICDFGQDGSNTWHGPGFEDADKDGVCDHWQPGGKGYGPGRR